MSSAVVILVSHPSSCRGTPDRHSQLHPQESCFNHGPSLWLADLPGLRVGVGLAAVHV